jgi:hypothetical protein
VLVNSYKDRNGVQHLKLDQISEGAVSFQYLTLSCACHQGSDVIGRAKDHCLYTHRRPQYNVQSMDQGANSGCTKVVSLTHVPLFLICKACDIVEEPLQLWTNGIYIHIQ